MKTVIYWKDNYYDMGQKVLNIKKNEKTYFIYSLYSSFLRWIESIFLL